MMIENYYTPQQLDYLKERGQMLGEERIRQAEAEWQELIAQARSAMQNGIDPTSEAVQELARRSQALIQEFTGGDAGIERSRLPDVPTRRSRSCQSRSDGFSFDGIFESGKSSPKATRVVNVKLPLARRENVKCTQRKLPVVEDSTNALLVLLFTNSKSIGVA